MKQKRAVRLLALVLLLSLLCACSQQASPPNTENPPTAQIPAVRPSQTPPAQNPVETEILITTIYDEKGEYTDLDGSGYEYSFQVPRLEDDTSDAKRINREIQAGYGDVVTDCLEKIERREAIDIASVGFESYRSGDVLSLVLNMVYRYGEQEVVYAVYNYDLAQGKELNCDELIALKHVTYPELLTEIRRQAAQRYDDRYAPIWVEYGYNVNPGEYQERRGWTVSTENITPNNLMLFLDDNGELNSVTSIGAHEYSDWRYEILQLSFGKSPSVEKSATYSDFFTATLKDGALTFRLQDTKQARQSYLDGMPFDVDIPVHGLYSDYVDIFCGVLGFNELLPDIFLLTKEGRVECVEVPLAIVDGLFFCSSGVLPGLEGIVGFESAPLDDSLDVTVLAVDAAGGKTDLRTEVLHAQTGVSYRLSKTWLADITYELDGGGSYEEEYWLSISEDGQFTLDSISPAVGVTLSGSGSLHCLGMTENGTVYRSVCHQDTENIHGVVALSTNCADDNGSVVSVLYSKHLSGDDLFSTVDGSMTTLVETFG